MRGRGTSNMGAVAALTVFCVFAVSVFAALAFGADVYAAISEDSGENASELACLSYIWTKVKNGDSSGGVSLGELGGLPALYITEDFGGRTYNTVIYHYGGGVRELFFEAGYAFAPEDGAQVLECPPLLLMQLDNGLIKATSGELSVYIYPRSRGAGEGMAEA